MIRHIVMWKFRPGTEKEVQAFLESLAGLYGVIPQIKSQRIGRDCSGAAGNYDAVLVSDFDSLADLEAYQQDPRHQAVAAMNKSIRTDRVAVDYEV